MLLHVRCCCPCVPLCYVAQVHTPQPRAPLYRTFLDSQQYSDTSIAQYERVFGHGFISPGGQEVSGAFLAELQLSEGMKVLDLGCGIGGKHICLWQIIRHPAAAMS